MLSDFSCARVHLMATTPVRQQQSGCHRKEMSTRKLENHTPISTFLFVCCFCYFCIGRVSKKFFFFCAFFLRHFQGFRDSQTGVAWVSGSCHFLLFNCFFIFCHFTRKLKWRFWCRKSDEYSRIWVIFHSIGCLPLAISSAVAWLSRNQPFAANKNCVCL